MNPRIVARCRIDTPLGPLTLAATDSGLAAALFDAQRHHPGEIDAPDDPAHRHLRQAAVEFAEYFAGTRRGFTVPLDAAGTPFQRDVWRELLAIEHGSTGSYGRIAARLGLPRAARAVGAAIGRNPISIVVPCHRVVGAGGALTGYAGGLPRKQALLRLEGATGCLFDDAPSTGRGTAASPAAVAVAASGTPG